MIGKTIWQASFHSHQSVLVHAKYGPIVRQLALQPPNQNCQKEIKMKTVFDLLYGYIHLFNLLRNVLKAGTTVVLRLLQRFQVLCGFTKNRRLAYL